MNVVDRRVPFWGGFVLVVAAVLAVVARVTGSMEAAVLAGALPCGLLVVATARRW